MGLPKEVFSSAYHLLPHHDGGASLFALLQEKLPHLAEINWETRAAFGGLYVNGIPIKEDIPLPLPAYIEYYEPRYDIRKASEYYPSFSKEWIVYEDPFFIVCFKPHKLPTMPAKEQSRFSLRAYLDEYVGHAVHCPSRIDTSTQGLVIASKDPRTHKHLQHAFEKKTVRKEYLLFTEKNVDWNSYEASEPIGKSDQHPVLRCVHGREAKSAYTFFEKIISVDDQGTLIRARPTTGRTHQIRVHASTHGFPIKGDRFYAGFPGDSIDDPEEPRLCLLSYSIGFFHPVFEKELVITVPKPLLPLWVAPLFDFLAAMV